MILNKTNIDAKRVDPDILEERIKHECDICINELDNSGDIRERVLTTALEYVNDDRDKQYGHPETCFGLIADFWGCYLGRILTADDVGKMMILLKIARSIIGTDDKLDNYIDIAGYAACTAEIIENAKTWRGVHDS